MSSFSGRVTHLASGDLWGGAEALVLALATEQHRVRPGSVSCIVMNPGQLAARLAQNSVPVKVLDESRQGLKALLREIRREVRRFSPHVLHAHRQKENLLATLTSLSTLPRGRRLRCITTVHGMPEPYPNANPLRRLAIQGSNYLTARFGLHALVAVSRDIERAMRSRYGKQVVAIHNGIAIADAGSAAFSNSPAGAGHLRLLSLGRLVPIKRFERLGALSDALAEKLGFRPEITLAGEGPLESELHGVLRPKDPERFISMPGFVADTHSLLRSADALVITSDHEGIPMAALEALALGVPVFGFQVGGLPEIAESGVPFRLAPLGDVAALAQQIVTFFKQYPAGTRLLPPQDWTFDIRQCARAYERLYSGL